MRREIPETDFGCSRKWGFWRATLAGVTLTFSDPVLGEFVFRLKEKQKIESSFKGAQ
jgi:hypothetical protein